MSYLLLQSHALGLRLALAHPHLLLSHILVYHLSSNLVHDWASSSVLLGQDPLHIAHNYLMNKNCRTHLEPLATLNSIGLTLFLSSLRQSFSLFHRIYLS